jgi:hypothetical protein
VWAVLIGSAFCVYSQETDTVKVIINKTDYDTIQIVKTVYDVDTVYVNPFIDYYEASPMYSKFWVNWRNYSGNSGLHKNQQNQAYGLEISASKGNFSVASGFSFSQMSYDSEFFDSYRQIDSLLDYTIFTDSYFQIDTTGIELQTHTYDSVLNDSTVINVTDTTYVYLIDSTEIVTNDTVFFTVYDTTKIDTSFVKASKIQFYEIPIILRYKLLSTKRFELNAGVGVIVGILRYSEIFYQLQQGGDPIPITEESKLKIFPSIWLSAKLSYYPFYNVGVFVEPYYNPGIKSILKPEAPLVNIPDRYGLRFGISYVF